MRNPLYISRIERKYEVGVDDAAVVTFWRELCEFLPKYGLYPVEEIGSIGSVYFDNKAFDLLRYSLTRNLRSLHVRLRAYELYGRPPEPISEYWIEVKIREEDIRRKKRFRIERETLFEFLRGKDVEDKILHSNNGEFSDRGVVHQLHLETRDTVHTLGLEPILLVTYKRLAFQGNQERVSIDWDIQYYHVGSSVLYYDSWKYPVEWPVGKAGKTIVEFKFPEGGFPLWVDGLSRRFPLWEMDYSKYLAGMWFLLNGPLNHNKEASSFRDMIARSRLACVPTIR